MARSVAAVDRDRRVPFSERDVRTHVRKRFADALHGAAGEGLVADEREAALLRREQAGDHAHRGAGVAAVERVIYRSDATANAVDFNASIFKRANSRAQGLHAGEGGCAVGSGGEIGEARGAFSECAEHGVAMADGLVAGKAKAAKNVARGTDDAFLRGGGQRGSGRWGRVQFTRAVCAGREPVVCSPWLKF